MEASDFDVNLNGFMAHGWCFLWNPDLIVLHVASDSIIALSYFAISTALLLLRQRTTATNWMSRLVFRSFATFIASCGVTHVMNIVVIFTPAYVAEGIIKLVTATASLGAAVIMIDLTRSAMRKPKPENLPNA